MHFTVLQVVATLVAFLAQFSRIFSATKPFWGKLPAVVQVWLPPIIPFAAALQGSLTGVTTWTDFAVAVIVSAALLLPGAPSNRSAAPMQAARPFMPPLPVLFLLTLVLACGLPGCSLFGPGGSVWPAVARCAPSETGLVEQVAAILLAGGDYESALLELAKNTTKEAVVCAAEAATSELAGGGRLGASPAELAGAARGKAFLVKTGNAQ